MFMKHSWWSVLQTVNVCLRKTHENVSYNINFLIEQLKINMTLASYFEQKFWKIRRVHWKLVSHVNMIFTQPRCFTGSEDYVHNPASYPQYHQNSYLTFLFNSISGNFIPLAEDLLRGKLYWAPFAIHADPSSVF